MASGNALRVLTERAQEIANDVLAESVVNQDPAGVGFVKELDVNGEKVILSVQRV